MPGSRDPLRKVLAGLSQQDRIAAWVSAVRGAGGLNFTAAEGTLRHEVFDLEQSTPPDQQQHFLDSRDRVLAVNAFLHHALSLYWLKGEAKLAQIACVLSMYFVSQTDDTKALIVQATTEERPKVRVRKPGGGRGATAGPSDRDLAHALVRVLDGVLSCDTSPLCDYWREVMRTPRSTEPCPEPLTAAQLLRVKGEALVRPLRAMTVELFDLLEYPVMVKKTLAAGMLAHLLDVNKCLLPPIPEYLERNATLSDTLLSCALGTGLPSTPAELLGGDALRETLNEPRRYMIPSEVISGFEKWLYPNRWITTWMSNDEKFTWRPWERIYKDP